MRKMAKLCECGCEQEVKEGNRFIRGHHNRGKHLSLETKEKIRRIRKGKTLEEIFGLEKARELRQLRSERMKGKKPPHAGKTWEEFFGVEKATELKQKVSKAHQGKKYHVSEEGKIGKRKALIIANRVRKERAIPPINKGKTYEEIFGEERAALIKSKMSEKRKGRKVLISEEERLARSERRKRLNEMYLGEKNPFFGKHHTEITKQRISENNIGRKCTTEFKERRKEIMKKRWEDSDYAERMSQIRKEFWRDPEFKNKMRAIRRKRWQDSEYVKNFIHLAHSKPNKLEQYLQLLLDEILPHEYKFVGDGSVVIGSKSPDFINVNGQKKLIELFGDYWHRDDDEGNRIFTFRLYGFDTLVIWEHELKDEELENTKARIMEFQKS